MAESKFLEIIRSFSPEENLEFPLFLNSPFFLKGGSSNEISRLFQCLAERISDPLRVMPDKTVLHAAAFPEKSYSGARLDRAIAKLGQLAEEYLLTKHYHRKGNEEQRMLDMATLYRERRIIPLYERNLYLLKKKVDATPLESPENYLFRYKTAREDYEWRTVLNKGKSELPLLDIIHNLDIFYLSERTEVLNLLIVRQIIAPLMIPDIAALVAEFPTYVGRYLKQSPILLIRHKIQDLFLQRDPNRQGFEILLDLIKQHEKRISTDIIQDFYGYLRGFCAILIDFGRLPMYPVLHTINQDNLSRGYFHYNGLIHPNSVLNITLAAIKSKQINWAKDFIESNRQLLMTNDEAVTVYNVNMAFCLFAEKKYEASLQLISFLPTFPAYLMQAKRLELMNYYETQSELLPYKIDAFRKFLERTASKSISSSLRILNLNFVKILQQLLQSRSKDAKRSVLLIKRIEEKKSIAERIWLLEKALELG